MYEHIVLQNEQKELLITLVEAARNIPKDKRSKFKFVRTTSESWVAHWGIPNWTFDCYEGDIDILAQRGFLNPSYDTYGISGFDLAPEAFLYYQVLMQTRGEPVLKVETTIRQYLDSNQFQRRHSRAFHKWLSAEELVWTTDTVEQLSTIGHLCREALQEFTASLIEEFKPLNAPEQKSHTLARLKAVFESQSITMPKSLVPFLNALIKYWETLTDLVQRQEHEGQREKEPLVWEDARRLVFHTMTLMYETDKALTLVRKRNDAANGS